MGLDSSKVHRNLDAKLKIMGLEAPDLLSVLIFAATMNLFFGKTALALPLVFVFPSLLLVALYFGKKGKPENYLIHLVKYLFSPAYFSAGETGAMETKRKEKIYESIS